MDEKCFAAQLLVAWAKLDIQRVAEEPVAEEPVAKEPVAAVADNMGNYSS